MPRNLTSTSVIQPESPITAGKVDFSSWNFATFSKKRRQTSKTASRIVDLFVVSHEAC